MRAYRIGERPSLLVPALGALFGAISLLVYAPALHGPFVFDDVVVRDSTITQATSLAEVLRTLTVPGLARRLTMASFALNFAWGGLDTFGYHVVNVLLHAANGVMLAVFAITLLRLHGPGSAWRERAAPIACAGSLLWLVHPVQSQAVAYVWQRSTALCAFFFLASLTAYLHGRQASGWRRLAGLAASLLAGGLALLSKENAGMLPVFVLLLEPMFLAPEPLARQRLRRALAAVAGLAAIAAYYLGPNFVALMRADYARRGFTLAERLLTEPRVVMHYVSLLVFPHPERLVVDYDFPLSRSLFAPSTTLPAIAAVGALAIGALLGRRRAPLASFGVLWFLGNLVIESSFVPLDIAYEHRLYLPSSLPLVLLAGAVIVRARNVAAGMLLIGAAALPLGLWTHARAQIWSDPVLLWSDNARKAPGKARVHGNFAKALLDQGRYDEAYGEYERALELDPRLLGARNGQATILIDHAKDYVRAHALLDHILSQEPDDVTALTNAGVLALRQGDPAAAVPPLERALSQAPNEPGVLFNLGAAYFNLKRLDDARALLTRACQTWPANARLVALLAMVLAQSGDLENAERVAAQARAMQPADPFVAQASRFVAEKLATGSSPRHP